MGARSCCVQRTAGSGYSMKWRRASDGRDRRFVTHDQVVLLRQRIFGIALGYEDCNDATMLRTDPVLKACCDVDPRDGHLASQPTLSRWENSGLA